ncbi:MAG: sigma 54-interacting transcriptional regulator [Desulfarculales bacterium]|jgi:transcriptional regulator with PAS, ATPase and Fis domain|nr:sigma 54-interacting transcriptional regulator [Desulfarculales bacterium]
MDSRERGQLSSFEMGGHLGDAVYTVNRDLIIVGANSMCESFFGVKNEEMIGWHIDKLWQNDIYDQNSFFFGYDETPVTELLKLLNEVSLEEVRIHNSPMLSQLAFEKNRTVSGVTKIKRNAKVVLIVAIPVRDQEGAVECVTTVTRDLTDMIELRNQITRTENKLSALRRQQFGGTLIGQSQSMRKINYLIDQIAGSDVTVLLYGETGTGKEVVAREIYQKSGRSAKPYIRVNCAAIPESLFESELFGYEKGAFTGALQTSKMGLLEMANGGTILLDEIGELSLVMQGKLLRALQEKEIMRIGGQRSISLDVRVIAATNRNLREEIRQGSFREDLYYRLNVVTVEIPPLRERKDDIPALAFGFLNKFNEKYKRDKYFEAGAIQLIGKHDWPGNIRALENTIERLVLIGGRNSIRQQDIGIVIKKEPAADPPLFHDLRSAVASMEKDMISQAVKRCRSTRKAARELGVSQPTVIRKMKLLGISGSK